MVVGVGTYWGKRQIRTGPPEKNLGVVDNLVLGLKVNRMGESDFLFTNKCTFY